MTKDSENQYVPHYYVELNWKDLAIGISCDIYIGDQIPNPPTHLKFTLIREEQEYKDINSKEIEKKSNEIYKEKFEKEILDKIGVKWKREVCR